ncbi:MAG TPA: FAD-binding protein [Bryobacteraceae bacterium]
MLSRRAFTKTLAAGSLTAGSASAGILDDSSAHALCGLRFDGTLYTDHKTRAEYAVDFGNIVHEMPMAVLKPGSVRDIRRIVQLAGQFDFRVVARGPGHSPFGQTQVKGGVVIDMRPLHEVHAVSRETVTADAGASWGTVVDAALQHGLTPPVLPDYMPLSVGGTLSIGGVGFTSFRYGVQVDNIVDLKIVTGDGVLRSCSESHNRNLFEMALAGQGQCGFITQATIRLVPAPAMVREFLLVYSDLGTLMEDLTRLSHDGRFDGFVGVLVPSKVGGWQYFLDCFSYFTPPALPDNSNLLGGLRSVPGAEQTNDTTYREYLYRLGEIPFRDWQPSVAQLIPASAGEAFLEGALPLVTPSSASQSITIEIFAWKTSRFKRPLFRAPDEEDIFGIAMLRASKDRNDVPRMLAQNRTLIEQGRDLGGTLYPFTAAVLSRQDWKLHYGPYWEDLVSAKHDYDPFRVIASGPDIFARVGE